jgi:transcriptional regulator with XRE-family HTH domain
MQRLRRKEGNMAHVKTVADWMTERGLDLAQLVEASALDRRVVDAIVHGRYTPSPEQRRRLAAVLGVEPDQVAWGHQVEVAHVYGHGPQFGRSP